MDIKSSFEAIQSTQPIVLVALDEVSSVIAQEATLSASVYHRAKEALRKLSDCLISHLGSQNKELLEELRKCFESDQHKQKLIDFCENEIRDVKVNVLMFFDEHPGDMGDISPKNFRNDFDCLTDSIARMIKTEEEYLLPLMNEAVLIIER